MKKVTIDETLIFYDDANNEIKIMSNIIDFVFKKNHKFSGLQAEILLRLVKK